MSDGLDKINKGAEQFEKELECFIWRFLNEYNLSHEMVYALLHREAAKTMKNWLEGDEVDEEPLSGEDWKNGTGT